MKLKEKPLNQKYVPTSFTSSCGFRVLERPTKSQQLSTTLRTTPLHFLRGNKRNQVEPGRRRNPPAVSWNWTSMSLRPVTSSSLEEMQHCCMRGNEMKNQTGLDVCGRERGEESGLLLVVVVVAAGGRRCGHWGVAWSSSRLHRVQEGRRSLQRRQFASESRSRTVDAPEAEMPQWNSTWNLFLREEPEQNNCVNMVSTATICKNTFQLQLGAKATRLVLIFWLEAFSFFLQRYISIYIAWTCLVSYYLFITQASAQPQWPASLSAETWGGFRAESETLWVSLLCSSCRRIQPSSGFINWSL